MNDLSIVQPNEVEITIMHPKTGLPTGLSITVMSLDDPRLKSVKHALNNALLHKRQKGKIVTDQETEAAQLDAVVAAVTSWRWEGDLTWKKLGKPEFTPENVKDVFVTLPWAYRQVATKFDDEKDFFSKS